MSEQSNKQKRLDYVIRTLRADFHFQINCSLAKYFACFLLNSEHQNNSVLHHHSQLKRSLAKIIDSELFRALWKSSLRQHPNTEKIKNIPTKVGSKKRFTIDEHKNPSTIRFCTYFKTQFGQCSYDNVGFQAIFGNPYMSNA